MEKIKYRRRSFKRTDLPTRYPNLEKWIRDEGMSVLEFSEKIGVHRSTIYAFQYHGIEPRKDLIDKILKYTGMSYEECFEEAEGYVQR